MSPVLTVWPDGIAARMREVIDGVAMWIGAAGVCVTGRDVDCEVVFHFDFAASDPVVMP